jgi:selenocysteine lyase/cysteine desulfurase
MLTRRACLLGGTAAALAPLALSPDVEAAAEGDPTSPFPHKDAFFPISGTYLNCASQHPVSRGGRAAINRYLDYKSFSGDTEFSNSRTYRRVLDNYAKLINADADEVCFVQSTTVGENLVLKALGFQQGGGRIITDDLHYVGSLPTYAELEKLGVEIVTLRADVNGSVSLDQFEEAITTDTRLVCVSSVSMVNGFRHDLKGLSDIAHAKGALVYADVVHEVGSMPFDVRASGVDFCSAASYKWLMGEQGLGFLYARKDRLAELTRPWFGHYQLRRRSSFGFPNPDPGDTVTEYEHYDSALGYFAMGSQANINAALLDQSLQYLLTAGPDRIQNYRQPLVDRLQDELPKLGFASITPRDTGTALVSFRHNGDVDELHGKLDAKRITISVAQYHLRISPSVFNDLNDIERLILALS